MATSTRPTKIFEELSRSTLNKMAEQQKIELDEYTSKGALVDAFKELAEDQAIRMLTAKLSRNDLSSICESVEVEYEEGVKNPSKAVMTKRLKEKMRAAGLEKFLNKLDGEFLQKFAEYTDVEIEDEKDLDDKTKKRSIAKHVAQVVVFEGVQSILNTYNVSFLGDMCKELGLKGTTSTKSKLIYALATHTSPKHLPSFSTAGNAREAWDEAAEESLKRKKAPQIKKGVTYQDLFQWYGVEELKEWCSENKLKVSGTKKELCNRILAYFDGDLENTLAENSKSGRSRSRSRSRSKSPHRKPVNKKKSKEDEEGSKKTKKSDEKSKKSSKSDEEEEEDSEPKNKKSKTSDKETKEKDNKKVTKSKSKEDKEEEEEEKEDKDEKKNKKGSKAGEKETSKKTKAEETDKKNKGKDETTDEKSNKKAKTTEESDNKKVTKSKSSEEKSKGKNSPKKGTKKGEDEEDDE